MHYDFRDRHGGVVDPEIADSIRIAYLLNFVHDPLFGNSFTDTNFSVVVVCRLDHVKDYGGIIFKLLFSSVDDGIFVILDTVVLRLNLIFCGVQ